MKSNKKQKSNLTDKKDLKVIKFFKSQLSKQISQNKSKYYFQIKEKSLKGNISSQSNNSINKNKISSKFTISKEANIKKITPKNNLKIVKINKIKEISEKTKKKDNNYISISSIKNDDKSLTTNLINNIENNSNIQIGSNNKITIIKNIFNRVNKPQSKNKAKIVQDIRTKIINLSQKNSCTITGNAKKMRNKYIFRGIRNKGKKKIINRPSLSNYNSLENINNSNFFLSSKNKNCVLHCNTVSDNLKISSKRKSLQSKISISLGNQSNLNNMNLSQSNFINTFPSLNNCKNNSKNKAKNIKKLKTLSINSENKYKKIYNNMKRKQFQKKMNLIRYLNKLSNNRVILKTQFSSTIGNINKKKNFSAEKKAIEKNDKLIFNNKDYNKNTIEFTKLKSNYYNNNNFYHKIKKIKSKNGRSNSISINIKNTKHTKFNSDMHNNFSSSLMNVRLKNNFYKLKFKKNELKEKKYLKKILPSNKYKSNKKKNNYENTYKFKNIPGSYNSINVQDEEANKNCSSNLGEQEIIVNDYFKKDEINNQKIHKNTPLKKYISNFSNDIKNNTIESNNIKVEEEQIFNNIYKNSLIMYSIYILSKYNDNIDKIGLSQIFLFDNKNNIIPVLYSNSNWDNDSSVLFANNCKYNKSNNKENKNSNSNQNNIFVSTFKQNLYINFFVNHFQSNNIHHIKILNFTNKKMKISPSKDIKIYHENILLYEGL